MTSSDSSGPPRPGSGPPRAHTWQLTGLCLAAVLAPFAWSTHFIAEYTLPKLFMVQLGVLLAAAGAAVQAEAGWRTPLDLPVAANLLVLAITAAASQDLRLSLTGRYNSYSHGILVSVLYGALCLGGARLDRRSARKAAGALLAGAAVIAAYGIAQVWGYEPFVRAPLPQGRAVSSIGSPVDLGAYLAAFLPVAAAWALARSRVWGGLTGLLIAVGLWATASRGAWLASAVGLAVFGVLYAGATSVVEAKKLARRVPLWAWAALALALAAGGWLGVRRAAARGVTQGTDSSRVEVWRTAWHIFQAHPWLGTGPDTFEQAFRQARTPEFVRRMKGSVRFQAYAHNDLLQALSTTGLLGTSAYLYFLLAVALAGLAACRRPDERWLAAGILGGLAGVFVNVKFNPIALEVMTQVAVLAGLLAALGRPDASPEPTPLAQKAERAGAAALGLASAACLLLLARWGAADLNAKQAQILFTKAGILEQADRSSPAIYGMRLAGMEQIRQAISQNPCEVGYRVQQMNEMGALINGEKTVPGRLSLLEEGLEAGKASQRCHPREVNSHYILGVAAWMHVQLGVDQLSLAEAELDKALELDPMFVPLLEQRLLIARRRGGPAVDEWTRRLAEAHQRAPN